jgi:hypothetical protein
MSRKHTLMQTYPQQQQEQQQEQLTAELELKAWLNSNQAAVAEALAGQGVVGAAEMGRTHAPQ